MMEKENYKLGKFGEKLPLEELKPCPCCGEPAEFLVGVTTYVARCTKCGLVITANNGKSVCRKWNKRVGETQKNEKD